MTTYYLHSLPKSNIDILRGNIFSQNPAAPYLRNMASNEAYCMLEIARLLLSLNFELTTSSMTLIGKKIHSLHQEANFYSSVIVMYFETLFLFYLGEQTKTKPEPPFKSQNWHPSFRTQS